MRLLGVCLMPVIAAPMAGGPSTPRFVTAAARPGPAVFTTCSPR
ncbi:hypothetical protein [Actinoplanes utahensis]|nr:hypothetical protein [Actinoplanes utahensis]